MSTDDPLILDPDRPFALPVPTEPDEIRQALVAALRNRIPTWVDLDTSLVSQLLSAVAEVAAEALQAVEERIGVELAELIGEMTRTQPHDGTPASSSITVSAVDALGHAIPAGASVWIGDLELVTTVDLEIAPGNTSGSVPVAAVEFGAHANGATGSPEIDPLDWVDDVVLDEPLSAGVDPEDDAAYRVRLIEESPMTTKRPILPEDFALRARSHPAVGIAWTVNGYNPTTNTTDLPLTGTVVVADDHGGVLPELVLGEVRADLAGETGALSNIDIHVTSPTYTGLGAVGTVQPRPGWDSVEVAAAAEARVIEVLSPGPWTQSWYGESTVDPPRRRVHVNELIAQADQLEGVDHVPTMTLLDEHGDPIEDGYVDLARPDGLPTAVAVTITAAA